MSSKPGPTTQIDISSVGVNTPLSKGDKREASSPLNTDDIDSKKLRQLSGVSVDPSMDVHVENGDLDGNTIGATAGGESPVHMLSQPMNPFDIVKIASELRSLMLPELANLLKNQLPDIKKVVTESTKTLTDEIKSLREENVNLRKDNDKLRKDVNALTKRVAKAELESDELQQYSRRNSIRISGVPEPASGNENTDDVVYRIANELQVHISPSDIDRSHRVGKSKSNGRHRDILVKFATYNARQRLYLKRMDLRESEDYEIKGVFLNEDLTKIKSKLLFDARLLARADIIKTAYSSDGKIFVRDNDDSRHRINTKDDILKFGDLEEARNILTQKEDRFRNNRS